MSFDDELAADVSQADFVQLIEFGVKSSADHLSHHQLTDCGQGFSSGQSVEGVKGGVALHH